LDDFEIKIELASEAKIGDTWSLIDSSMNIKMSVPEVSVSI
jgi:hypothetical protein